MQGFSRGHEMGRLKLSDVAKLCGVDFATVWRWAKLGLLGEVTGKPATVSVEAVEKLTGPLSPERIARGLTR
jgi:hypothetical protein